VRGASSKRTGAAHRLHLGMSAQAFLRDYWQKKPLLIPQALPNFQAPIGPNDLASIACMPDALARVIAGRGKRFSVQHGPFDAAFFAELPPQHWTLLVQNVDRWDDGVRTLLDAFDFLPRWRIEDVMVSYAVRGGSVGAHTDQYDVFLLQAAGQRRWQIDAPGADHTLQSHSAIKLLKRFTPAQTMVLSAGDMLYLPPGVGHHGVALDDACMTFSIGLRAPSDAELLADFAGFILHHADESDRYRDADLQPRANSFAIDPQDTARAKAAITRALQQGDAGFADWFAGFVTRYRANALPNQNRSPRKYSLTLQADVLLRPSPHYRFAQRGQQLYVGGARFSLPSTCIRKLLHEGLSAADLQSLHADQRQVLQHLLSTRALIRSK
jgi:50S ribosomal protein L16 3-hydroxylase